ncbi:MAG: Coq4 family protein, partial [Cyanobacteriota bacterium]
MGFRYLNRIATPEHIQEFLELADLAAGGGADAGNVFELSRRLSDSRPMRLCERRLKQDPASAALIAARRPLGPHDLDRLLAMPKGSLGHTYATVMQTLGYDINFFPEPSFYNDLASDADYINHRVYASHDIHHIISGFSLDNFGETGVISISIAQFSFPAFVFLDLIGML